MNEEEKNHFEVRLLTESNAKAIQALTKTVDKLAEVMAKEDDSIKEAILELTHSRTKCEMRIQTVFEKIDNKTTRLEKIENKLECKVRKEEFVHLENELKDLKKMLWTIGVGVVGIVVKFVFDFITKG